jgi:hypothetical protein
MSPEVLLTTMLPSVAKSLMVLFAGASKRSYGCAYTFWAYQPSVPSLEVLLRSYTAFVTSVHEVGDPEVVVRQPSVLPPEIVLLASYSSCVTVCHVLNGVV